LQVEEGRIQAWNKEVEELLGLMPEQMKEFSGLGFSLPVVPQDSTTFLEESHPAKVAFQTRQPYSNQVMGVYNNCLLYLERSVI
jgi:PAS domain-containing protein